MPFFVRYVDGDLLCFVHEGAGTLETEFGPLTLPQRRLDLPAEGVHLAAAAADEREHLADDRGHRRVPGAAAGPAGPALAVRPVPGGHPEPAPIDDDGRDEYEVRLFHRPIDGVGPTTLFYQHNPIDVEGWRGDNFAFTFNIADYNVITSDSVHLPPTVHLFMQATGVYVMNFLPKPAETVPGTERTPWYHRNVDFDEIAFFHGGSLYGIPMPPGLICHAPQGVHHGAPEKARERARRKFDEYDSVDWPVIAIDTRRRLVPSAEVLANDLGSTDEPHDDARQARLRAHPVSGCLPEQFGASATSTAASPSWWCWRATCSSRTTPSDTVLVFMHPIGGGAYLPMINALARAGHHVIYCNSRFRGTDSALLMEKVVEDLGECHQGRQEPAGLLEGGAGRLERRRLAVDVLPAAGAEPDRHREPVRRRTRPHRARADPGRRHHAAGRPHQPARHADRMAGRLDPRRVRPHQARPRTRPLQPRQPQPAAVHRRVPGPLPPGPDRPQPANHRVGQGQTGRTEGGRAPR